MNVNSTTQLGSEEIYKQSSSLVSPNLFSHALSVSLESDEKLILYFSVKNDGMNKTRFVRLKQLNARNY